MNCNWKNIIAASIVFQASLAWNDVFKNMIERYVPIDKTGPSLQVKILYAIIITVIVIAIMEMVSGMEQFIATSGMVEVCKRMGNEKICKKMKI